MVDRRRANWEKTPEWQRTVDRVLKCKEKGLEMDAIVAIVGEDKHAVKRIIEDEELADERAREEFDRKIPTIQNIISLSLGAINDTLKDMAVDDELRKRMLGKVSDVALLVKAVESLNTLLRLELGKSTQNIAVKNSYQQTREVLQEIAKVDPVFDYPTLPEGNKE